MKFLENLKLDKWYTITLYLGVLLIASSLFFEKKWVEEKHLFGLGIGLILIGLSMLMAVKSKSTFKPPNVYTGGPALLSWKEIKHNPVSIMIMILGFLITGLFGYLIVRGLI